VGGGKDRTCWENHGNNFYFIKKATGGEKPSNKKPGRGQGGGKKDGDGDKCASKHRVDKILNMRPKKEASSRNSKLKRDGGKRKP